MILGLLESQDITVYYYCTYIIFIFLCNLYDLLQTTLSETAKHWDSFLTHCILHFISSLVITQSKCSSLSELLGLIKLFCHF